MKKDKKKNGVFSAVKNSAFKTKYDTIGFILIFLSALSACLSVFYAGHKRVSVISFIMSIANYGLDIKFLAEDKAYFLAAAAVIFAVISGLFEIILSLFSSFDKVNKIKTPVLFINTAVFCSLSLASLILGARAEAGVLIIFIIYFIRHILNLRLNKRTRRLNSVFAVIAAVCAVFSVCNAIYAKTFSARTKEPDINSEADISVVSFNTASAFGSAFDDTDSMTRCGRFASYMSVYRADLIGTQELNPYWLEELKGSLSGYGCYGVERGGDGDEKHSETNAVFWNSKRFTPTEKNTFWLSETPDTESVYAYTDENGNYARAGCYRICTYVILEDGETGRTVAFLNTHLDNASEQAADFGAEVILNKIQELKSKYSNDINIILTGDFNETCGGEAYKLIAESLTDCTDSEKKSATYQSWGYRYTGDEPIDFIFTDGTRVNYSVLNDLSRGYISDHYGVYAQINF